MTDNDGSLVDITMPALGADMRDGTLTEWLVSPGDTVNQGDSIAVIETNKGAIEMEAYHSGTITALLVEPRINLPVGSVLARMACNTQARISVPSPKQSSPPSNRLWISPAARYQAYLGGIASDTLEGSGPNGAIILRDLPSPSQEHSQISDSVADTPASSAMRQAISAAVSRSKQEIPHYYLSLDIDIAAVQHWLMKQNQKREPEDRLLLAAVLLTAIARTLSHFSDLNGFYRQGRYFTANAVHLGNTISLRSGGVMNPAILNAEQQNVDGMMQKLRDLTERSRRGRLRSSEIEQATVTVTNVGDRGTDSITGVIYPPQVAIIGLGRPRKTPVVINNSIEISEQLTVTLAADHRVSDGLTGARFLQTLSEQLQHPEAL